MRVSTIISQERKKELKSEREKRELQGKIKRYDKINWMQKRFALIAIGYLLPLIIMLIFYQKIGLISSLVFILLILYIIVYFVLFLWFFRRRNNRRLKELSKSIAFYAAASAAEQLEEDNLIEASFCADKLLGALLLLVEHKSIKVESWKSPLKNLLYVKPRDIQNMAVLGAIQDSAAKKQEFAEQFYTLADSLSKNLTGREYMVIRDFLKWLSEKSQHYELPIGFWQRHPNYSLENMAVIAPIIGSIVMFITQLL